MRLLTIIAALTVLILSAALVNRPAQAAGGIPFGPPQAATLTQIAQMLAQQNREAARLHAKVMPMAKKIESRLNNDGVNTQTINTQAINTQALRQAVTPAPRLIRLDGFGKRIDDGARMQAIYNPNDDDLITRGWRTRHPFAQSILRHMGTRGAATGGGYNN
jgi:hypothetical protein